MPALSICLHPHLMLRLASHMVVHVCGSVCLSKCVGVCVVLLLNLPGSEIDGWHHHVQPVTVLFMPPGLLVLEYSRAVDRGPVCVLFMSLLFLILLKRAFLL